MEYMICLFSIELSYVSTNFNGFRFASYMVWSGEMISTSLGYWKGLKSFVLCEFFVISVLFIDTFTVDDLHFDANDKNLISFISRAHLLGGSQLIFFLCDSHASWFSLFAKCRLFSIFFRFHSISNLHTLSNCFRKRYLYGWKHFYCLFRIKFECLFFRRLFVYVIHKHMRACKCGWLYSKEILSKLFTVCIV